jgi:hypothetical protein
MVLHADDREHETLFRIDNTFASLRVCSSSLFQYKGKPVQEKDMYLFCKTLEKEIKSIEGDAVEMTLLNRLKGTIRAEREVREDITVYGHTSIVYRAIRNASEFLSGFSHGQDLDTLYAHATALQSTLKTANTLSLDIESLQDLVYLADEHTSPVFGPILAYTTPTSDRNMQGPSGTFRRQLHAYARRTEF